MAERRGGFGGTRARLVSWAAARPALAVAAVALLCQANTLLNQPVLDDGWVIFDNPVVTGFDVGRALRSGYEAGGSATNAGLWRPLTTLSYAASYAAFGRAVPGYHVGNALLHAAVALLVLALARRVVGAVAPARAGEAAVVAALLFAVHPVHVEAVAGLVGRAELLAALGALSALLLALTRRSGSWRLPAALGAASLGVLGKENAAVAPLLYLLVAWLAPGAAGLGARPGPGSAEGRRAAAEALLVSALLGAAVALPFLLRPGGGAGVPPSAAWFAGQPGPIVLGTMSRALAEYWRLLAFPGELGLDFFYAAKIPFTPALSPRALAAAAVWATILVVGLASARRAPVRAIGILWVFAALLPVSNAVPTGVLMAERLLYLPSVGACLWAGHGAAWAREALSRRHPGAAVAVRGLAALAIALLAARTLARNADWRDGRALWEAELAHAPRDPVVNNNLAVALNGAGEYGRARERLRVALEAAPLYWRAWVNLGIAEERSGDPEAALGFYGRASAIEPGSAVPHYWAGLLLARRGDRAAADRAFAEAERLAPDDASVRVERGRLLLELGRAADARRELEQALRLDPRRAEARALLEHAGPP